MGWIVVTWFALSLLGVVSSAFLLRDAWGQMRQLRIVGRDHLLATVAWINLGREIVRETTWVLLLGSGVAFVLGIELARVLGLLLGGTFLVAGGVVEFVGRRYLYALLDHRAE